MRYDEYLRLGYGIGSGVPPLRVRISKSFMLVSGKRGCGGAKLERVVSLL